MTYRSSQARHRAARRPSTPLDTFATAISSRAGSVGRTTAIMAASSGLLVAGAAQANATETPSPDASSLSADARNVIGARSIVAVPESAEATTASVSVEVLAPAVEVAPQPVVTSAVHTRQGRVAAQGAVYSGAIPDNPTGSSIVSIALRYLGVPYVFGGKDPSGFDCSGFTQYVYGQAGISIPRTDRQQLAAGTVIPASQAVPGDLVWSPGHITIYLGNGQQVEAPNSRSSVRVSSIWQSNPTFVRIG